MARLSAFDSSLTVISGALLARRSDSAIGGLCPMAAAVARKARLAA
jgi:hypothetical protein